MHTIKITPNLLFGYQCTSGKFIRLPNRIEKKIDSVARIESKLFCTNWNALLSVSLVRSTPRFSANRCNALADNAVYRVGQKSRLSCCTLIDIS